MKLRQRLALAANILTQKQLYNSLGAVERNYVTTSNFNPPVQLRGIAYKAIDKIGQTLSVYEPIVTSSQGDPIVNHPLYNLYNAPNRDQTASDFIHLYAMLFEIYGETFWYLARGEMTKKTKEIILLDPSRVELVVDNGELTGYKLHKANGEKVPLELEEVIHDKSPNPFNQWRGMSVMEKASVYIDLEINTAEFTLNYIKNNASPSGIVSLPNMDTETFKQFAAQWREGYEGPKNAGKTAFVRGEGVDFKAVGATLQDIDQEITRKMAKEDVLSMFEIPKGLLGISDGEGLGRAQVETLDYMYAKSKLEPRMRRLDRIYEKIFLRQGMAINVEHKSPVPEDKEHIHKQVKELTNVALTVNESRALLGLEPLPGYDELKERAPQIQPAEQKTLKIVKKRQPTAKELAQKQNEEQETFRRNLVDTNTIYEKKLKTELSSFTRTQRDKIIAKINAQSKAYEDWLFEIKSESEALATVLAPIIIELMEAQSEDVAHFITGELLTISPEIRQQVEARILKISGVFNEDTLRALEKTLTEGQLAGESLVKLKKRVESIYQDAQGYRAERIARTESLRASNSTAELVYKQNGFSEVEWFTNPSACEFCRTFSGRRKTIGSNYINVGDTITGDEGNKLRIDYDDIGTPPLHPNCTCSLVPV